MKGIATQACDGDRFCQFITTLQHYTADIVLVWSRRRHIGSLTQLTPFQSPLEVENAEEWIYSETSFSFFKHFKSINVIVLYV